MPAGAFFRIRIRYKVFNVYITSSFMKLFQYLKETKSELKEVVFPTTSQTITYTIIVIIVSILVAVSLGGLDLVLRELLAKIVNL